MSSSARLVVAALAVMLSACGNVQGPGFPECAEPSLSGLSAATILQLQAVPDAEWGPCIDDLEVGWEYESQFAESGRAVFWLDSDRVGSRFLEVELTPSCDPGSAEARGGPEEGIQRFVRVDEEPGDLVIAVVPVAPRHEGFARAHVTRIVGMKLAGRTAAPFVEASEGSASDRVQRALTSVGIVLILDDADVASDTVELRRAGHDPEIGISLENALDEIADDLGQPAYRAEWFHTFEGGCVVCRFDAHGSGVEAIPSEVSDALGFYRLAELRKLARDAGFSV